MPHWTTGPFLFPINLKTRQVKRALGLSLPTGIGPHWPNDINPHVLTGHQDITGQIPHIHEVLAGETVLHRQVGMHGVNHFDILHRGRSGFNVSNQAREIIIARFSQMDLIADPGSVAFVTVAGLCIVGGYDHFLARWQVVLIAPLNSMVFDIKLLEPHRTQDLNRCQLP